MDIRDMDKVHGYKVHGYKGHVYKNTDMSGTDINENQILWTTFPGRNSEIFCNFSGYKETRI